MTTRAPSLSSCTEESVEACQPHRVASTLHPHQPPLPEQRQPVLHLPDLALLAGDGAQLAEHVPR